MATSWRMTLPPVTLENADPEARPLLDETRYRLGFVPNMYANMANAPSLLSTYIHGYRLFRERSGFTPTEQEVIFLTISRFHGCTYCMGAHSMIATNKSGVPQGVLAALREGRPLPDSRLEALSRFTRRMVETRGRVGEEEVRSFLAAGYDQRQILEIVLAIAVKTLSNYSNHLFGTELDRVFAPFAWQEKSEQPA